MRSLGATFQEGAFGPQSLYHGCCDCCLEVGQCVGSCKRIVPSLELQGQIFWHFLVFLAFYLVPDMPASQDREDYHCQFHQCIPIFHTEQCVKHSSRETKVATYSKHTSGSKSCSISNFNAKESNFLSRLARVAEDLTCAVSSE